MIFNIAVLSVVLLALRATSAYPFKARVFPLISIFIALTLLIVQIIREIRETRNATPSKEEGKKKSETEGHRREVLGTWAWIAASALMLWILGFMGTVVFLPFLYFRFQRESWLLSALLPIGCGIFFYTVFGLALKMPLYQGLLFLKLFAG